MRKRITTILAAAALSVSMLGIGATPAFAAHCTDNGGPGNSDFADHVRNRADGHNEGEHRGWSTCEENSNNYTP